MSVFAVENLSVTFVSHDRRVAAVRNASFSVEAGRTLAIVGESGSGKSVSLLAATGLLGTGSAVVEGSAFHNGVDLVRLPGKALRRIRGTEIGFIFQDPLSNLHPLKTIGQQMGEAISSHVRVTRREKRRRVIELLGEVGIKDPQRRMDDYPVQFSGGMRQRAMIASAIALKPALLIADEATTSLDVTVQAGILRLLERLQEDYNTALIFVSHDLAVVSDIADDIIVMRTGEIVESGQADAIYDHPRHVYTQQLLSALSATRYTSSGLHDERAAAPPDGEPLLTVASVSKDFPLRGKRGKHLRAVDNVSFEVRKGEIVGLVGESGSGKSTIGRIVAGLARPTAGTASLEDETYNAPTRREATLDAKIRPRIQVVFQDPYGSLNPRRDVRAILEEPFRVQRRLRRSDELRSAVETLMTRVELPVELLSRYPAHLSGGQRQRIAIARALALHPDLVVADEPVSALDVTTQDQILALIRHLREELGVSFLFVSHDLSVVAELCDRVLVLSGGRVVEEGITRDVFQSPKHEYTKLLIDSIPGKRRADGRVRAGKAQPGEDGGA